MKLWGLVLLCILLLPIGHSAKLVGTIYDNQLEPIKQSVVYINTTPEQTKVSRYGGYLFFVDEGTYEITVELTRNNITKIIASDIVKIPKTQGEISRDLFLLEGFDITEEFKETFWTKLFRNQYLGWIIAGIILIALVAVTVFFFKRRKAESKQSPPTQNSTAVDEPKIIEKPAPPNPDEALEKRIVSIIQNKDNATQKDIRKEIKLSEAKISLVITKLEEKGKVKRIKHGRSNLLVIVKHNTQK